MISILYWALAGASSLVAAVVAIALTTTKHADYYFAVLLGLS
jgi:hypothetical protein